MGGKTRTRRKAAQGAGVGGGWTRRGLQSAHLPLGLSLRCRSAPLSAAQGRRSRGRTSLEPGGAERGAGGATRGGAQRARLTANVRRASSDASKPRRLKLQADTAEQLARAVTDAAAAGEALGVASGPGAGHGAFGVACAPAAPRVRPKPCPKPEKIASPPPGGGGVNSAQNLGNRLGFRGQKGPPWRRTYPWPPGRRGGALFSGYCSLNLRGSGSPRVVTLCPTLGGVSKLFETLFTR